MVKRFQREGQEFGRGLGFFDAMYGFAITLLVANIVLPPASDWTSLSKLLAGGLGTQLVGFLISFVVIAMFWKQNTELLGRFTSIDGTVIGINLVSACLIVAVPFTTEAISDPQIGCHPLAVALYAANVALAVTTQLVLLEFGRRARLLEERSSPRLVLAERLDYLAPISIFLLSIPIAYTAGPQYGKLFWLLLLITGPLLGIRRERAGKA